MMSTLLFGTHASRLSGMGHFMRCFALAEEARVRGIGSHFLLQRASEAMCDRLQSIGASWHEAGPAWIDACVSHPCDEKAWWIIDCADITAQSLGRLRRKARVLYFDDACALERYDCDIVVNASPAALSMPYAQRTDASTRLLAGPPYSMVRREFRAHAKAVESVRANGPRVAIMLGGSDASNLTGQVVRALREALPSTGLDIVLGPASAGLDELRTTWAGATEVTILVNPPDLALRLAASDLVVTAAGGSMGELCALRQAALALVVVDNQAKALADSPFPVHDARNGVPADLGLQVKRLLGDPGQLRTIREAAGKLVDGLGPQRTLDAMEAAR